MLSVDQGRKLSEIHLRIHLKRERERVPPAKRDFFGGGCGPGSILNRQRPGGWGKKGGRCPWGAYIGLFTAIKPLNSFGVQEKARARFPEDALKKYQRGCVGMGAGIFLT